MSAPLELIPTAQSDIDHYTNTVWRELLGSTERYELAEKAATRMPSDKVNAFIGYAIGHLLEKHKAHYGGDDYEIRLSQALYDLQGLSCRELARWIDAEMDALLSQAIKPAPRTPRTR